MQQFTRNEKHYCKQCGQHLALHIHIQSSATEPEEYICPDEPVVSRYRPLDQGIHDKYGYAHWQHMDIDF